ncbi:unnamed protein product, partial [marine sediment metagenome]
MTAIEVLARLFSVYPLEDFAYVIHDSDQNEGLGWDGPSV